MEAGGVALSLDASVKCPAVELDTKGLEAIKGPAGSFPRLADLAVPPFPAEPAARFAATTLAVALFIVAYAGCWNCAAANLAAVAVPMFKAGTGAAVCIPGLRFELLPL